MDDFTHQVALEGIEFHAYHGVYEEERKIGNKYQVDIYVSVDFESAAQQDKLTDTVNYEVLYRIVKEEMAVPSKLLENIAFRVSERALGHFPQIQSVKIRVKKFNPPVGGLCKSSTIFYQKERKEAIKN